MEITIELRRHTDNDGDVLSPDGVAAAVRLGGDLAGGYRLVASSGAQRATQTAACLIAGLGERVPDGVIVVPELRSGVEDRWRDAYGTAGAGDLESLRSADPDLVDEDSARLAGGLEIVLSLLEAGDRALAIGHSPTNEAAVYGLTGETIDPLGKGEGVSVARHDGGYRVEPLD